MFEHTPSVGTPATLAPYVVRLPPQYRAITQAAEVVGEVNGRFDTRDDEPARPSTTRGAVRLGARYTVGGWRGDVAAVVGLTSRDAGIGFAAGFTYVFTAFQIP